MGYGFEEGRFPFAPVLLRKEGGVVLHFGEKVGRCSVGSMEEGELELYETVCDESFMNLSV